MAVVNTKSAGITNMEATPPVLNNPSFGPSGVVNQIAYCAVANGDSIASVYRFFRVPSNAVLKHLYVMHDGITGASAKFGITNPDVGATYNGTANSGVPVTGSDSIFAAATSIATAVDIWTDILFPSILAAGGAVANVNLRIWELLGLSQDPNLTFDVVATLTVAATAGGNLAAQMDYVR